MIITDEDNLAAFFIKHGAIAWSVARQLGLKTDIRSILASGTFFHGDYSPIG